jgi:hypothetical protein
MTVLESNYHGRLRARLYHATGGLPDARWLGIERAISTACLCVLTPWRWGLLIPSLDEQPCSDRYARRLDVINRGLSGYNTDWAIPVFEQVSIHDSYVTGAR